MSPDRYRTAIVTGAASRGIGAATVRQLCISGLDAMLSPARPTISASLRARLAAEPLALDISHRDAVLGGAGRARRRRPGQQCLGVGAFDPPRGRRHSTTSTR